MSTAFDRAQTLYDAAEPPEPRFACMECGTGIDGSLAELEDDELTCQECGSSDIDLYSRIAG